jgi:Grap2 and cyclin-D-interacting
LSTHITALRYCATQFAPSTYGATLHGEVVGIAKEVIQNVWQLVDLYLKVALGTETSGEYLIRTGEVHNLLERAKRTPKTNAGAVRKRWDVDRGGLEDALKELSEMLEEQQDGSHDEAIGLTDDMYDDCILISGQSLDQEEVERAKQVGPSF